MTVAKQADIARNANTLYRAFPADPQTVNHTAILKACEIIKRVQEYTGAELPKYYLEQVHRDNTKALQALELDSKGKAYNTARKALQEAESLSSWVLLRQDISNS